MVMLFDWLRSVPTGCRSSSTALRSELPLYFMDGLGLMSSWGCKSLRRVELLHGHLHGSR